MRPRAVTQQFRLSEEPIIEVPEDEIDGFINLIFSVEKDTLKKAIAVSKDCQEAILYGVYKNTADIQKELFEIQKVKQVIADNKEDRVALRYLNDIFKNHINLLNHAVLDSLYSDQQNIVWFYNGKKLNITNRSTFNKTLSEICEQVYFATPVFKNELNNKTKVSGQISLAKNKLTQLLLSNVYQENIGFDANKFPPEKTIYLSFVKETTITSKKNMGNFYLGLSSLDSMSAVVPALRFYSAAKATHKPSAGYPLQSGSLWAVEHDSAN